MRLMSRWGGSKFGSRSKREAGPNWSPSAVKHATEGDRLIRLINDRRQEAEANAQPLFTGPAGRTDVTEPKPKKRRSSSR